MPESGSLIEARPSPLWLVSRPDGRDPRVLRASTADGAVLARLKDDEDPIQKGDIVAAWRLGNFPHEFQAGVRTLGRPGRSS